MTTTTTTNSNYLSPQRFVFIIDTPEYANISFNCQSVTIPSIEVPGVDVPYQQFKPAVPGDQINFTDFNAKFIIDESLENYKAIYDWMLLQVSRTIDDKDQETKRDVALLIYNNNNNISCRLQMIGTFPTSLSAMEFTANVSDTQYLYADVTFSIDYYEIRRV